MIDDEDLSLVWSPEPPRESLGAGDCRPGGSSGLDFNCETRRARWVRAWHRYKREQNREAQTKLITIISAGFDTIHRPCRCAVCVYGRITRMLDDLDREFGPPPKEVLQ